MLLNDRRAPEYIENIEVDVAFRRDDRIGGLRPVMTIVNRGSEVVSLLAIRVAAMDADRIPLQEWTEIVATPLAIEGEWRGPLMPGATRNVVLSRCLRSIDPADASSVTGAVEIADVRLWKPTEREPI